MYDPPTCIHILPSVTTTQTRAILYNASFGGTGDCYQETVEHDQGILRDLPNYSFTLPPVSTTTLLQHTRVAYVSHPRIPCYLSPFPLDQHGLLGVLFISCKSVRWPPFNTSLLRSSNSFRFIGNLNVASLGHDTIQAHIAGYVFVLHYTTLPRQFEHHLTVAQMSNAASRWVYGLGFLYVFMVCHLHHLPTGNDVDSRVFSPRHYIVPNDP